MNFGLGGFAPRWSLRRWIYSLGREPWSLLSGNRKATAWEECRTHRTWKCRRGRPARTGSVESPSWRRWQFRGGRSLGRDGSGVGSLEPPHLDRKPAHGSGRRSEETCNRSKLVPATPLLCIWRTEDLQNKNSWFFCMKEKGGETFAAQEEQSLPIQLFKICIY